MNHTRTFLKLVRQIYSHPANTDNRIAPIGRFFFWQSYKRLTNRKLRITVFNKYKWDCNTKGTAAGQLLYANANLCDFHEMSFMAAYLRPGDNFLDVGANAGIYTLFAHSLVTSSGTIHSFEADPDTASELHHNLALNDISSVTIHNVAVSDKEGEVLFTKGKDTTNHVVKQDEQSSIQNVQSVKSVRLDEVFDTQQSFAMGKMDIEGAEPLAFQGATKLLAHSTPPVWLLELNGLLSRFESTEAELVNWLAKQGYRLAYFDAEKETLILNQDAWKLHMNVLAIAEDSLKMVLERLGQATSL